MALAEQARVTGRAQQADGPDHQWTFGEWTVVGNECHVTFHRLLSCFIAFHGVYSVSWTFHGVSGRFVGIS